MADVSVIMTSEGAQPTAPATIRTNLETKIAASSSDYTSNLPGSLIEDLLSTSVGAVSTTDAQMVDLLNSVSPLGINAYYLTEFGNLFGFSQGGSSLTSVYIVFTGTVGYPIPSGFTVSDGSYEYQAVDGGIISSDGTSDSLFFRAVDEGSWAVAADTVTTISTSVPSSITLTCTNPEAGTPGDEDGESDTDFRSRVYMGFRASATGFASYLKTRLYTVDGVQSRLVSIVQKNDGWEVLCGGGDPYEVAYQIYKSTFDFSTLVSSDTSSRNITASIIDYPDTYDITFVNPVSQTVTMTLEWNTSATNSVSSDTVASLGKTALAAYINALEVGQPLNIYDMQDTFRDSISTAIQSSLITRMEFTVYIDGTEAPVSTDTGIIEGDSEGYFTATTTGITITKG